VQRVSLQLSLEARVIGAEGVDLVPKAKVVGGPLTVFLDQSETCGLEGGTVEGGQRGSHGRFGP
jgi:hypothetical protein